MCLSTAYFSSAEDSNIILRYVSEISVSGREITLTDVMGSAYKVEGALKYIDLTSGTVIIEPAG